MNVKDIVNKHNKSCNNAKILAQRIYNDLRQMDYTDEDLINVYREMYRLSLSTYELECLTKKKMCMDRDGVYKLIDVDHMGSIFSNVANILKGKSKD